ncbi:MULTISPECIES: P-loop ATPase [unclassified Streptomyces]|uniref:RapZ C-terminal domain-containing protein n=1 Tax=unclassified Streptomyces TaxID=2593676 RepID=UPI003806DE54
MSTEPENTMTHDAGPHDAEGWKLHDDGTRVHRYGCTIHDGEGCDGHCGPIPSEPVDEAADAAEDADWIDNQVGPRKVGGRYYNGYWGQEYEVLNIDDNPDSWGPWEMTVQWADGRTTTHCTGWDPKRDRVIAQPPQPDVTIVSIGRLHNGVEGEYADVLQRATIALDLSRNFRDPHVRADLRQLTAHDQVVRDTVMATPGVRQVLAATALQVQGYLAGPTAAPLTVVTQCAGGRHRAATTAMALRAVVSGDVEEAAAYGLADAAEQFTGRDLVVDLVHRDLDKDVVDR